MFYNLLFLRYNRYPRVRNFIPTHLPEENGLFTPKYVTSRDPISIIESQIFTKTEDYSTSNLNKISKHIIDSFNIDEKKLNKLLKVVSRKYVIFPMPWKQLCRLPVR